MSSRQFLQARKVGEKAQAYCAGMFRSWGLQVIETPRGLHPEYDLEIKGILNGTPVHSRVEIKYDLKADETKNIYLDVTSLSKSKASILCICLGKPIHTTMVLPLEQALQYAVTHKNVVGGEFMERSCIVPLDDFISELKPKVLKL